MKIMRKVEAGSLSRLTFIADAITLIGLVSENEGTTDIEIVAIRVRTQMNLGSMPCLF